ncbi:MAG: hypothetical protein Kow0069_27470 [Promethearchaeota archaeon]
MKAVEIDPAWERKVRELAQKFNRYVTHRSVSNTVYAIERLVKLLDSSDQAVKYDAAKVLSAIQRANPELITDHTRGRVEEILWSGQEGYVDVSELEYDEAERPELGESFPDEWSEWDSADGGDQPAAGTTKYEVFDPEVDARDPVEVDPLSLPVGQLGLKNIEPVEFDPAEMGGRKCALGDGELDANSGPLWRCASCGTIYHEPCLKLQGAYEGACKICDAEFKKKK